MSGHSQFKNIMYRKGAQDAKKARVLAKLAREITVAAKSGLPEPDKNPRLRLAIQAARAESMPKDNIERAIAKATTVAGGADFVSMRYEGFSSGKVAVIVEAVNGWEWWAPYATNIIFQGIFANQTYDEAVNALGFRYLMKPKNRQD